MAKSYDQGFRDGYYAGLDECGPISGVTGYFKRRGKLKKLSKMKEGERVAALREALAEHEAEEVEAKKRFANPTAVRWTKKQLQDRIRRALRGAQQAARLGMRSKVEALLHYAQEDLNAYKKRYGADRTYHALEDRWAKIQVSQVARNPKKKSTASKKKPKRKTKTRAKRRSTPSVGALVRKALQ